MAEYKLENVAATSIASDKIDETFRSTSIGEFQLWPLFLQSPTPHRGRTWKISDSTLKVN